MFTGRFPVRREAADCRMEGPGAAERDPGRRLGGDRLRRAGQPVAVVGFPVGTGDSPVISPPRGSADKAPETVLEYVRGDLAVPETIGAAIRTSLADDLAVTAMAEQAVRRAPGTHLFVYLSGLSTLDVALRGAGAPAAPEATRDILLCRYHVFLDGLLKRLDAAVNDDRKAMFIFSGDDGRQAPIRCRPRVPPPAEQTSMGFFVATGRNIRRAERPVFVAPVDLAMTWLYLAAAPLPMSMDGAILYGILNDEFYFKHPYRRTDP
jgi:hypothetical protein